VVVEPEREGERAIAADVDNPGRLRLTLLGRFEVRRDEQPIRHFRGEKVRALLAYLATESGQVHTRGSLAALLWPEQPDDQALRNLTQALVRLRTALGDNQADVLLDITRQTVACRPTAIDADVIVFGRLAVSGQPAELEQALAVYGGEFLAGFALPGCAAFEEWLRLTREQLLRQALAALQALGEHYLDRAQFAEAVEVAQRQLALRPWHEVAYRQLMHAQIALDDRATALATYARCRQALADNLGHAPSAETQALGERVRAGALLLQRNDERGPPHSLPMPLTPFVGREHELAAIVARLQQPASRLLTLVGPGGMGKTRLAIETGCTCLDLFPDGVCFVALAALSRPDALAATIATALGLHIEGEPRQALSQFLHPRQQLLILDNFEHLLPSAFPADEQADASTGIDLIVELVQTAPRLRVIVTSRIHLNLHSEYRYVVDGLSFDASAALAQARECSAVQLFVQHAARVQAGFTLNEANLAAVLRICQLVEGMPLALELAASWVELLAPAEIADEIARSVDFLASDWQDLPSRQRSMRAVFEWSWRLLNADEQRFFSRLAVFRGGFTRDAAEAVTSASLGMLTSLRRKLLLRLDTSDPAEGRYEIHELLRQFAAERLRDQEGDATALHERHAGYYLLLATDVLSGPIQAGDLMKLDREHDNLRAALNWAWERGELELGLRLATALWPFWQRRSHLSEGRRWLEGFLAVARLTTVAPELRVLALTGAGWLATEQNDFAQAVGFFVEAQAIDQALGRSDRAAGVLAQRGILARGQGQYREATALLEEGLALARAASDRASIAYALFRLGLVTRERGDYTRAEALYHECLAAYQVLGDRSGYGFALLGLGDIGRDQGDAVQIEVYCQQAQAVGGEMGQHIITGFALNNLALAAAMRGELASAAALADEALALFVTQGIRGGVLEVLVTKGRIAIDQGDTLLAQALLAEGLARGWPSGPHWLIATALEELARVALAAGDPLHAVRLCSAAAAWRATMDSPLPLYLRPAQAALLAAARNALGDAVFGATWNAGATWQPQQAVEVARAWLPSPQGALAHHASSQNRL
jgi:predicted ATPase/DNA-binding SARP family transcriptional activator